MQALPGVGPRFWATVAQDREGWRQMVTELTEDAVLDAREVAKPEGAEALTCPVCGYIALSEGGAAAARGVCTPGNSGRIQMRPMRPVLLLHLIAAGEGHGNLL